MDGDFIRGLQSRGIDVLSALDAKMIRKSDEEHLKFATEQSRALYTFNIRDFRMIHAAWLANGQTHCGIVMAQQKRYSTGEQIRRMLRLLGRLTAESIRNREEFLNSW